MVVTNIQKKLRLMFLNSHMGTGMKNAVIRNTINRNM